MEPNVPMLARAVTLTSRVEVAITESTRLQKLDEPTTDSFKLETPKQTSQVQTID